MPIDRYMELCNTHYYSTRDPLGKDGDFTTAPEICQVFGETIAIWAITKWQELGSPQDIAVMELGPGRGTLMADFLRAIKVAKDFQPEIHLVEISPTLTEVQKEKLSGYNVTWHTETPDLEKPVIVIANEFFDALPVKQFMGKKERLVVSENNELAFDSPIEDLLVKEVSPISEDIMRKLSKQCAAGVIIDYGYSEDLNGDSLQALKGHKFHNFLDQPGEADLTAHVNFAALKRNCSKSCSITTQKEFLLCYGGDVRGKMLGLEKDFSRLVDENQMGRLFKVLCF